MKKNIKELFNMAYCTINYYEEIINNIENNPELIMNKLYIENTHENLLTFLFDCVDSNFSINFQKNIYNILIPHLKKVLDVDNIEFSYYGTYPSLLGIYCDKIHLVDISIYEKTITIIENKKNLELEENIYKLELEVKELNKALEEYRNKKSHPFISVADKPFELMYAIVNTKKHLKKINNEFKECLVLLNSKETELRRTKIILEQKTDEFIKYATIQKELVKKIQRQYNYTIV